jgi:hypothetical protein
MSLTVNFRTESGTNQSRIFKNGQGVSLFGKATGALGLGEPFTHVRFEIEELGFFAETRANVFGDYDFFFRIPATGSGVLTLRLTATFSLSGQDTVVIPIAYGSDARVPPVPPPPVQGDVAGIGSSIAQRAVTTVVLVAGAYLLIRHLFTKVEK